MQVPILILNTEAAPAPVWTHHIWTATLQRLIAEAPLGLHLAGNAWIHLGWPLLIALLLAGVAGLVAGLRGASADARWIAGLAVPIAVVMFVVSIYERAVAEQMVWPAGAYNFLGSRYVIVPAMLLISAAIVLIDRRHVANRSRGG